MPIKNHRGYTLIELIVAVGLFAIIMLIASGAYLVMIGLNRQAQGISTGIDNLAFALETMTRKIRTGTAYDCNSLGDCTAGASFTFLPAGGGAAITYARGTQVGPGGQTVGTLTENGSTVLTDPSVNITALSFYASGTRNSGNPPNDYRQPYVTIIVTGEVYPGPGRPPQSFTVQTGAAMRGTDL